MSFSDLTKAQKQYVALGGVVAVVFIVIIVFGIKVSLSSITESKQELDELSQKIEIAGRSLSRQGQLRMEFAETTHELRAILKNIPPNRNYYSWATEIIYDKARQANLEIDAVDELTRVEVASEEKDNGVIKLESYSLRITARSGFDSLKNFLELIEKDHPLARVTGIDISTGTTPEMHDIQLFIQWPFNLSVLSDAWESIEAKQQVLDEPIPEGSAPKKMPVPPAPRPGSTQKTNN